MERTVSEKNTKAQILEAYEKLLKKVEEKSNDNPREVQQRTENTQTLIKARHRAKPLSMRLAG